MNNRKKGYAYELKAIDYLKNRGYKILEHQYRNGIGEIDVIIEKEEKITFVEVKYRANISNGLPRESVTLKKQNNIKKVAQSYIMSEEVKDKDFTFDVIEIIGVNEITIEHIKDAFM